MNTPAHLAVFVSGGGTNLQALLNHFNAARSPIASVELVVASREGIVALDRSHRAGVATRVVDPSAPEADREILSELERRQIDLIVLAGYLSLVPYAVVDRFRGRMLNIHPALLPAFGGPGMFGSRVHRAVLASGARVSGATVHFVGERYDEGGILAQWPVPVHVDDTPEILAARVLRVEHLLLPAAIELLLGGAGPTSARAESCFEIADAEQPAERSIRRFFSLPNS